MNTGPKPLTPDATHFSREPASADFSSLPVSNEGCGQPRTKSWHVFYLLVLEGVGGGGGAKTWTVTMGFSWEYDRARAQCRIWGLPLLQLELDVRFYGDIQNRSKTCVDTYIYIYIHS